MATNSQKARMKNSEFFEFFVEELKDIYWAEQHLAKALKKFKKASSSPELADAFEKHILETADHINMVEKVFKKLGEEPQTKKCKAMEGLLKEADEIIADTEIDSFTRDAGLILAAQKVEHYEIATYGTLRILAGYLETPGVVDLLEQILQNEKDTDVALTIIAENHVNECAAAE